MAAAAVGSTENEASEDDSSDESTPFMIERDAKFTFQVPSASSSPSDVTELGKVHGLKHAKGHLDGPIITPGNSPQKKHAQADVGETKDLPPPSLLFPPSTLEPLSLSDNDVFGTGRPEPSSSGTAAPGSLFTFWHRESTEEKSERNSREFEELSRTREQRELHAERTEAMRKAQKRADDRERQQKRRDVVRDEKIASGWKPYQKRVSFRLTPTKYDISSPLSHRNLLKALILCRLRKLKEQSFHILTTRHPCSLFLLNIQ